MDGMMSGLISVTFLTFSSVDIGTGPCGNGSAKSIGVDPSDIANIIALYSFKTFLTVLVDTPVTSAVSPTRPPSTACLTTLSVGLEDTCQYLLVHRHHHVFCLGCQEMPRPTMAPR